jgi:hypothetical protein
MESTVNQTSRLKKIFRRTLFGLAVFITLGALFLAEEDWRGSRAWNKYKSDMEAKGRSFDPTRLIPPKVPDDQNLAMIPFFAQGEEIHLPDKGLNLPKRSGWHYGLASDLTIWAQAYGCPATNSAQAATNVLEALNRKEPWLAELESATSRPYCSFYIDYQNWSNNTNVQAATMQQFVHIKWFFRVMVLRAEAELASGQPNAALRDLELMIRVNKGLRDEPLLISQLVGYATAEILLQPIAQGLVEHRWSDDQLKILEEDLQKIDLLSSTKRCFEGERDFCLNPFFAWFKPRGWSRMEQLNFNRALDDDILPRIDLLSQRIDPAVNNACDLAIAQLSPHAFLHHRLFAAMTLTSYGNSSTKTAATQTDVDEVMIACALERFHLTQGHYPNSLDDLTPQFASALPHDIINAQPFHYRRTSDGKFVLYSVGWNGTDDGGTMATNKAGNLDNMRGDWVLEYPQ